MKGNRMKKRTLLTSLPVALVAAFGLLTAVFAPLAMTQPAAAQLEGGIGGGASSARGSDQPERLDGNEGMFKRITDVMLFITGAVSVIMLIIGGIRYVVSNGDAGAVTSAKNTILYAIIGIIVTILAYAVVNFVIAQFASGGGR